MPPKRQRLKRKAGSDTDESTTSAPTSASHVASRSRRASNDAPKSYVVPDSSEDTDDDTSSASDDNDKKPTKAAPKRKGKAAKTDASSPPVAASNDDSTAVVTAIPMRNADAGTSAKDFYRSCSIPALLMRMHQILKRDNMTFTTFSQVIGISGATISQLFHQKYKHDAAAKYIQFADWLISRDQHMIQQVKTIMEQRTSSAPPSSPSDTNIAPAAATPPSSSSSSSDSAAECDRFYAELTDAFGAAGSDVGPIISDGRRTGRRASSASGEATGSKAQHDAEKLRSDEEAIVSGLTWIDITRPMLLSWWMMTMSLPHRSRIDKFVCAWIQLHQHLLPSDDTTSITGISSTPKAKKGKKDEEVKVDEQNDEPPQMEAEDGAPRGRAAKRRSSIKMKKMIEAADDDTDATDDERKVAETKKATNDSNKKAKGKKASGSDDDDDEFKASASSSDSDDDDDVAEEEEKEEKALSEPDDDIVDDDDTDKGSDADGAPSSRKKATKGKSAVTAPAGARMHRLVAGTGTGGGGKAMRKLEYMVSACVWSQQAVLPVRSTKLRGIARTVAPTFVADCWHIPSILDIAHDCDRQLHHMLPICRHIHIHATGDTKQQSSVTVAAHRGAEDPRSRTIVGRTRDSFINIGGPVAAADWCPVGDTKHLPIDCTQYLAIAARSSEMHNRLHKRYSGPHMIQLWDFGSATDVNTHREPYMTMAILHNGGTVWDMMWYPDGAWQPPSDAKLNTITSAAAAAPSSSSSNNNNAARLGVLAVAFGDGSLQVITIPHPRDVRTKYGHGLAAHDPVIINLTSLPRVVLCESTVGVLSLHWSPHCDTQLLLAGFIDGGVALWDVSFVAAGVADPPLVEPVFTSPTAHQDLAVIDIKWHPLHRHTFASSSHDGFLHIWDTRDPYVPVRSYRTSLYSLGHIQWVGTHTRCLLLSHLRPRKAEGAIKILWFLQDATFIQTWQNLHHLSLDPEAVVLGFQSISFEGVQFSVVGYNNGEVNAVASPTHNLFSKTHSLSKTQSLGASRGLSTTYRHKDTRVKHEEKDGKNDASSSSSSSHGNERSILLSNGAPTRLAASSKDFRAMVKSRKAEHAKAQKEWSSSAVDMALDDSVSIHCIRINTNVQYPRWIASGGMSGIVRIQVITDC